MNETYIDKDTNLIYNFYLNVLLPKLGKIKKSDKILLSCLGNVKFYKYMKEHFTNVYIMDEINIRFRDYDISIENLRKLSMQFDKVIMNPPYDGNLHLKILEQVTKSCPDAEVVCIQPAKWILDPFINDSKDKKFAYMIDKISKYEIIPNKEMNKYFKLSIGDGVITFFEKNNTCNYKNDFTEIAKKITSISNYATVLKNHSIKTDFFIPLAKFRWTCGDEKCGMPYSLILNSSGKYAKSGWTSHLHDTYELFYFNTQSEVDNLKLLFKNTILPKIIGKIFYGKRMPMRHIPLPGDYTSLWTNERLYKYFNLTDDEIKYIEKVVL